MTLPRLAGPRLLLLPVPDDVADAVVHDGDVGAALAGVGLVAAPGWPHDDTADALRPGVDHRVPGEPAPVWLAVDGDEVVGEAGLAGPLQPDGDQEIGYGLAASRRRAGLGTEAVALLAGWVEQQPGVRRVVAEVLVGNEASQRLLARLGFLREPATPPYERWVRGRGPGPVRRLEGRVSGRHVC